MGSNTDPIVLSFHESLLRESDIQLLQGPHWLNDQIISFYFEYLEKFKYKNNSDILFISPEVTQCIKIVPDSDLHIFLSPLEAERKSFIFFPLNDNDSHMAGGSHWSLLVFSRPEKIFLHFDSSGNSNYSHCQIFVKKLKDALNCKNALCKPMKCLQQTNAYDCGIHVLAMADHIASHINRFECVNGIESLNHDAIVRKRKDILKIISSLGGKVY
ncbi:sentrin-specific protease 8 [Condylostylus longicornis]|uniref:sentrin-specific protease 8 n=1 Tax=Condylostylus longicornis TaxID=2530218 RepID=UPI00244E136F|nr:sentrin-specific protease 8 [Condylostylus longicornis]XP_055378342.1 sentrin-specific protease 8 [Condylostylus longicornis]